MVSKIVSHAALIFAQNKKDRVRILERGLVPKISNILRQLYQPARNSFEVAVEGSAE